MSSQNYQYESWSFKSPLGSGSFEHPFQTTHLGNLEDVSVIWTRCLWVSECPGLQKAPIDKPERWDVREQREAGTAGSCSSAAFEKPPGGPCCRLGSREGRATLATLTEPNDLGGPSHRCLNQPYQTKRDCLVHVGRGIHRVDDKSGGCPPKVIWIPTGRGEPGLNCHFPTSSTQPVPSPCRRMRMTWSAGAR